MRVMDTQLQHSDHEHRAQNPELPKPLAFDSLRKIVLACPPQSDFLLNCLSNFQSWHAVSLRNGHNLKNHHRNFVQPLQTLTNTCKLRTRSGVPCSATLRMSPCSLWHVGCTPSKTNASQFQSWPLWCTDSCAKPSRGSYQNYLSYLGSEAVNAAGFVLMWRCGRQCHVSVRLISLNRSLCPDR